MAEETGKRIGDYEILGVLGAGGMGQVFKVRNVISDRVEAMKILLPDLAGRQDLADRFLREIKVLAALDHPNIAALRTALTLGNQLVMVMEFVEGTSLATRLERGPITPADALNYIDQVLAALSYAHARQVIHRDIKPANMMLTPEGVVKLMDFGIARVGTDRTLTATGTTMGSMYYMSPEQVRGGITDARSDLYSLGVTLYEMVTGQRPFKADSDYSLMAAQVQQLPRPPIELRTDMPAALNEIILLAMAKEPAQRFQSADAFRKALSSVRGDLQKAGAAVAATQTATHAPAATALFQSQTAPPAHDLPTASAQVAMQPNLSSPTVPSVTEPSAQHPTHRGLYMTLGALVVLAVLVVAGIYVPRRSKTRADEAAQQPAAAAQPSASTNATTPTTANAAPATDSTAAQANAAPPADSQDSTTAAAPAPSADASTSSTPGDTSTGSTAAAPQPPSPPTATQSRKTSSSNAGGSTSSAASASPDAGNSSAQSAEAAKAEQLEQLEKEVDQLSSRSAAIHDSLDNLRRQQSADGFGLRGDIASAQESLKIHMAKAQQALQNQDVKSAKRYLDLAEPEVEKLEKFLGH